MTVYYSVKNTAKNGQLIRADRRDYILTLLLIYGGYHILHNPNVPDEIKQDSYNDFYPDKYDYLRDKGYNFIFANMKYYDISSTQLRSRIANGETISDIVTEEVERYIKQNGLYKN